MKFVLLSITLIMLCSLAEGQTGVSLLDNSPFMPPGKTDAANTKDAGPASLARLQLRGITSIDGGYIFSVYNPDTRESKWLSEGVEEDGLVIKSYDVESNSVVVHSESENLSRQMNMNEFSASVALTAMPTPRVPTPQPQQVQAPGTPSINPTGTLTRVQQEIQRPTRRNLETLRERREELADKLRKQPQPSNTRQPQPSPGGKDQPKR